MKKIKYIVRKRALGDVLWIEPVIRSLAYKYDKVFVHTKFNELFQNYPLKNVLFKDRLSFLEKLLIQIEQKLGISFLSVNLDDAYEKKPELPILHAYQLAAKLDLTREYPKIFISEKEKTQKTIPWKYAVLHIESFSDKKYREIRGIEWDAIVSHLSMHGYKIIQPGIKDKKLANTIHFKTSVRELVALLYHADLFIGIDSGPSHIASSLQIPSIIIFGALDPSLRHFKEVFNGILLKQDCAMECDNVVSDKQDHKCVRVSREEVPPCCMFQTDVVISALQSLIKKNVLPENHQ